MAVTGIGGFVFRARDPAALRDWYARHLGVGAGEWGAWDTRAGPSVFSPVAMDAGDLAAGRPFLLNFRTDDLDGLVAALEAAGVAVTRDPAWDAGGFGRFARLADPEGNPVELWEPAP